MGGAERTAESSRPLSPGWFAGLLAISLVLALGLYLSVGAGVLTPGRLLDSRPFDPVESLVFVLRLKRAALAVLVGAGLAVSGCAFQALLRNPLADPFVVGVSGGAAVGGTLVMVFLSSVLAFLPLFVQSLAVSAGAFAGALATAAGLYWLSRARGVLNTTNLLLMGVVFNFFASSVILFLKSILHGVKLQEVLLWLMGSLAAQSPGAVLIPGLIIVAAVTLVLALKGRQINLLSVGEEYSVGTGLDPEGLKKLLFVLSSLLVAICVSLAGFIGFVGLIMPHMVRLIVGADHRVLFPLSALAGSTFLLLADWLARQAFDLFTTQLPVGVITSFIGGPLFIYLLARSQRSGGRQ